MQNLPQHSKVNPLAGLMRQPKLFIKLPSKGQYWPKGSISTSPNKEFAVFSMTAKDELMLKNPNSLATGQAVVNVIQSCMPDIADAWATPSIDLDAILIAIRIATYGPIMEVEATINEITDKFKINLHEILAQLNDSIRWDSVVEVNNMTLHIQPLPYNSILLAAKESVETQKIMNVVNDDDMSEERKLELFKNSFVKLTDVTLGVVAKSVYQIDTPDGSVTDPEFILEFMEQCDSEIFNAVNAKLDALANQNTIRTVKVNATPEMIAAGSKTEEEIPVVFDPNTFFA